MAARDELSGHSAVGKSVSAAELAEIRRAAFGKDLGRGGWMTEDELWQHGVTLGIGGGSQVLEVQCATGIAAIEAARRFGCRWTGIDLAPAAIEEARRALASSGGGGRVRFEPMEPGRPLGFPDASFDAVLCIDGLDRFPDRASQLLEWRRVLRAGKRALFSDCGVLSAAVSAAELHLLGALGPLQVVPTGFNERLVGECGFRLVQCEDTSEIVAVIAGRWRELRAGRQAELTRLEGKEKYEQQQRALLALQVLSAQRRLQRRLYLLESPI